MKLPRNTAAFANPFLPWSTFGLKMLQMSTAAAQVIAMRTARMAAHGPNPNAADRRELHRMGAEKVDAFTRAGTTLATGAMPLLFGMAMQAWRTWFDLWAASTRLDPSRSILQTIARQQQLAGALVRGAAAAGHATTSAATARLAHRALGPVHRKATANAKRLAKKVR
ncbi:MAG: polyhydroxyalkanoate granule-associated phasin [Burkholderiaceae bacterium]